jgi:hypothetical protein
MPLAVSASLGDLPGLMLGSADLTGNTGVKIGALSAHTALHPEGQQIYLTEPGNAESFALAGMEIYNDILRKKEEEKAKKAEEEKQRQLMQKPMEMPQGVQMQNIVSGAVIISK